MNRRFWFLALPGMLLCMHANAQEIAQPAQVWADEQGNEPSGDADAFLNEPVYPGIADAEDAEMVVPEAEMLPTEDELAEIRANRQDGSQSAYEDGLSLQDKRSELSERMELELPNPEYRIESIHISGNMATSRETILKMLGVEEGTSLTLDELERARFKLALGGLFESVQMELHPGTQSGALSIDLHVRERSRLYFNRYYIGSSDKSPFWLGLDVSWLAPFNTDHRFRMGFAATTVNDYTLDLNYLVPTIAGYPISLMFSVQSMHAHEGVFGKNSYVEMPTMFGDLTSFKKLDDLIFERHGANVGVGFAPHPHVRLLLRLEYMNLHRDNDMYSMTTLLDDFLKKGYSHLTNVEFRMAYDSRSGREMSTHGHFVSMGIRGTFDSAISDYTFIKINAAHQSNFEVVPQHVIRLNSFAGMLYGEPPFFEKYFFNDFNDLVPSRIHRLNPSDRGAYDLFGTGASGLGYEDFLVHFAVSYAWQILPQSLEIFALVGATWANSLEPKDFYLGVKPRHDREYFPADMTFNFGFRYKCDYGIFLFSLGNIANFVR
ncbi:MAG: BamA/TamA family outer membrane protein [Proteobacteria bacterium]|nr:BamA/TamA family outer membrane protein [Pseudomonadota bacterium]